MLEQQKRGHAMLVQQTRDDTKEHSIVEATAGDRDQVVAPPLPERRSAGEKERINLVLPPSLASELRSFAETMGRSLAETVRWMFGIALIVWDELNAGNRIVVVTRNGRYLKEIPYPR